MNDRHRVSVKVMGIAGSGKSTIAVAIAKALADLGCKSVVFKDGDSHYDESYSTLYRNIYTDPDRVKRFLPEVEVEITTCQIRRGVI